METKTRHNTGKRYSDEVRERSVRMVLEHQHEHSSQSAAIGALAPKIGCGSDTLRKWVKQHEIDIGMESGVTSSKKEKGRQPRLRDQTTRGIRRTLSRSNILQNNGSGAVYQKSST